MILTPLGRAKTLTPKTPVFLELRPFYWVYAGAGVANC